MATLNMNDAQARELAGDTADKMFTIMSMIAQSESEEIPPPPADYFIACGNVQLTERGQVYQVQVHFVSDPGYQSEYGFAHKSNERTLIEQP